MKNKIIKYIGYAITLVAFMFIGKTILSMNLDITYINNPFSAVILIILMSVGYAISVYISSYAWKTILEFVSKAKIPMNKIMPVYVKSNIAKYLPGNFMHFAGRNLLAGRLGFKQLDITFCSILEIIMLLFTSFALSLIFAMKILKKSLTTVLSRINPTIIPAVSIIVILLIIAAVLFICKKTSFIKNYRHLFTRNFPKLLCKLFCIYSITLIIPGIFLLLILKLILSCNVSFQLITIIISSYTISWVLGFVVPGAPGGIGVRESTMLLILGQFYSSDIAVLAAILLRILSILGDLTAFLFEPILLKLMGSTPKTQEG